MSYDFDGSGSANLNVATPITALPFTIACWYKVEADGAGHALLSVGNATDSEMMRLSAQTDIAGDPVRIRAANSGGTNADTSTSTSVTQNTWEHACAVISSTTVRSVYRNGGGKASSSSNSRNITAATRLAIGAAYQAGSYSADTEGKIAHVAVWNIALSDAEVALLAGGDNPLTVQSGNLVAYWPLTADLVDVVGALTLTNGGGVTFDGADNPTVDSPPGGVSETPGVVAWQWTGYAPTVSAGGGVSETPGAAVWQWAGYAPTVSDFTPTVTRPAGGGDVATASTVVTDGQSLTPTIEIFGDPESNDNISGTKWEGLYADVDLKQAGRTPVFKLDFSDWRVSTPPSNNKLYWRYASDIGDLYAWQPFDNRSVASSILTVSNNSAFTETAIQIANIPPVPYEELEDWLTTWDANANIYRPQACADLAVSSSAPNKYAYFDFPDQLSPDGIQVGTSYAFAFGVTNPAVTSPKKRLFHTWTHAGEWGGLRAMMRFAERVMSVNDADHDILRDEFEHIFMFCNTAGMVGGMARGSAEPGDVGEDTNRVWGSNPIDRSDIADTQNAIEASVDLLVMEWGVNGSDLLNCTGQIAWHSHTASATKFGTYSDGFSTTETAFLGYLETIYGTALHNYGASSTGSSTAFSRTGTTGGFGVTFEWSYAFADFLNEIDDSVDTIAPALVDTFQAGYFGQDLEPSPALWRWQGYAPTAGQEGAVNETPAPCTWQWLGHAPTVIAGLSLSPSPALWYWTTYAPTLAITGSVSETPSPCQWRWAGYAPTVPGADPWTLQAPATTTWTVQ